VEKDTFRLFNNGVEVRLELVVDARWRVVSASKETGFKVGDEVSPLRKLTWRQAKRRVNSARSALSPMSLVLLKGEGQKRSEKEIAKLLKFRPWEPDQPPPAA